MKVLSNIQAYLMRVCNSAYFKYAIVCIVGILVVGFLDDNSWLSHFRNLQRIDELTEEKAKYTADFNRDQSQIKELNKNPKAIEKIARERYYMKQDDEDIFVLSDDDREVNPLETDESIE